MSSISGMITSLKNNKRTRVSNFEKLKDYKKGNCGELHFDKKASSKQLKRIRERIQKENKEKFIKRIILLSIFILVLIYFVGFYKI